MQKQFNNYFRDLKINCSLNNHSFDENEHDLVITESEEIKIKTHNGILTLLTKKEKNYSLHEFSLICISPKELKIGDLESIYAEGGILSIEAPLPKDEPKHRLVQIEDVLEKVELQVSNEEHAQHLEHTFREIASLVSGKCINPETKRPYTISMIGQAMRDIHFSFNPNRNAKQQILDVIRQLKQSNNISIQSVQMRVQ
ncbi:unnamed protein product [Rotaria sordida]|uniref:Ribosome maturation protein SDO1/SBDS central domain-containing protein n=1 Tax=Rotaria sordida TaxID=392033 RepID=A0A815ASS3_9BILA|nr:unnamed protein product [Rotaria sordida]CAF4025730.1 unnamed protein product [Rotaria sordida]